MRNQPAKHTLTSEQQTAFDEIKKIIDTDKPVAATLSGVAGVGKTVLLRHLVRRLGPTFSQTVLMAPTHKAAEVLGRKTNMSVSTIHSTLGMHPKPDGDGGYKFVQNDHGMKNFFRNSLLAVDEASMVPQELYDKLMQVLQKFNLSVIFCGDPEQLPPVNENPSPALEHDGYKLETIVRQEKDNPIIQTSMEVRRAEDAKNYNFTTEVNGEQGVEVVSSKKDLVYQALQAFDTEKYRKQGDHARILAYRNAEVEKYNKVCRSMLYEDTEEQFIEGEWLVAKDPWYGNEEKRNYPVVQNSEEFVVQRKKPASYWGFDTWVLEISPSPDSEKVKHIEVLNRDELDRYEKKMDELAEKARKTKDWGEYYAYKEDFAHVDYSYSCTTHRCLPKTAEILTESGLQPILEVNEEDKVWTKENRYKTVSNKVKTGKKKICEINTHTGTELNCSSNHKILTQRGWTKAKNLDETDKIAFTRPKEIKAESDDFGYLLGFLVGDGCYSYEENRVDITMAKDSPLKDELKSLLEKYGRNVYENPKRNCNSLTIWTQDKEFRNLLKNRGMERVTVRDKKVPELYSEEEIVGFLQGIFDADGHASKNRRSIRLVSVSRRLIGQVKALLHRIGIVGYIRKRESETYLKNKAYVLTVTGTSYDKFVETVSFRYPKKKFRAEAKMNNRMVYGKTENDFVPQGEMVRSKLLSKIPTYSYGETKRYDWNANKKVRYDLLESKKNNKTGGLTWRHLETALNHFKEENIEIPSEVKSISSNKFFYDEIDSIQKTENKVEMVDIEVEDDHSFAYEGAIVHNSQGSTFEKTFVDIEDINACLNPSEIQRLKYVAVTRASKRLVVFDS